MSTAHLPALSAWNLTRRYRGDDDRAALVDASVKVARGERLAIVGRSGSGKSTLLHLLGLLDRPDAGEVEINGQRTTRLRDRDKALMRAEHLGFVFQAYFLRESSTALENVISALRYSNTRVGERTGLAMAALERVGLEPKANELCRNLSGGERQRVAVARATVRDPDILLADEPTGNLDRRSGELVIECFERAAEAGAAVVIVTHDLELARRIGTIVELDDGAIVDA